MKAERERLQVSQKFTFIWNVPVVAKKELEERRKRVNMRKKDFPFEPRLEERSLLPKGGLSNNQNTVSNKFYSENLF